MEYNLESLTNYDWAYHNFVRAVSEPHDATRDELERRMWLALINMEAFESKLIWKL